MKLTILESNDAPYNLACEEIIFNGGNERFILWRNNPSVIIGRHQITHMEADVGYAKKNRTDVVRRVTGGGAVYHDLGNINYSVIKPYRSDEPDAETPSEAIAAYIRRLGVLAETQGRNDLSVDGKKFSGAARTIQKGYQLHHGTILFDTNLEIMERVLTVNDIKYSGRSITSIRNRVVNLREYLPDMTNEMFWERTKNQFKLLMETCGMTESECDEAAALAAVRYRQWDWNFGSSPHYTYRNMKRVSAGTIEVYAVIADGIIKDLKIHGDFITIGDLAGLEH